MPLPEPVMSVPAQYRDFLAAKVPRCKPSGLTSVPPLTPALKPFQAAIVAWALRRGRAALFEGTGLGKTLQQLVWSRIVADHEQGRVLILTPLAVAEQTVGEAVKFDIPGVAYAADMAGAATDIVVTNYERFAKFRIDEFAAVVLDESGIIKSQDGATRALLTEACRNVPWRLCCTATPAPNDYAELGQHAEFLGVMNAKEMLAMFFVHDGAIRADDHSQGADGWRLKRHAAQDYADPVWDDINQSDVLSHRVARDEHDERHISPLQLTVVRRCIQLWTNPGEIVLSPFAGIGTAGYVAVEMGRRFIGAELKPSYYRQAVANLQMALAQRSEQTLFAAGAAEAD